MSWFAWQGFSGNVLGIWKGYFPEESHVGYVTNGVHFPTGVLLNGRNYMLIFCS